VERDLIALYLDLFAVHSGTTTRFRRGVGAVSSTDVWCAGALDADVRAAGVRARNLQPLTTAVEMIRRFAQSIVDLDSLDSF